MIELYEDDEQTAAFSWCRCMIAREVIEMREGEDGMVFEGAMAMAEVAFRGRTVFTDATCRQRIGGTARTSQ